MNVSTNPATEGIPALVRELLSALGRQRRGLQETIRFLEENIPAGLREGEAFHMAVAEAAREGSPEIEAWALGKAAEKLGSAVAWRSLRDLRFRMADYSAAADADARLAEACLREGNRAEALTAFARCCDRPPAPGPSRAIMGLHGLAAALLDSTPSPGDAVAARRSLRKHVRYLLDGARPGEDWNLAYIDMSGERYAGPEGAARALQDFQALVLDPKALPVEKLARTDGFRVLWRGARGVFLADAGQAKPVQADEDLLRTAALCSHFRFPSSPGHAALFSAVPPEPESREDLIEREGCAIRNLGLLGILMGRVMGVEGYAHPDVARLMDSLGRAGSEYAATGRNTDEAYGQLVHFFCVTSSFSNAFMSFLIRLYNPPYPAGECLGILGHFSVSGTDAVVRDLKRDGIHVFDSPIPDGIIDDLVRFAKTAPCYRKTETEKDREPAPFPQGRANGSTYDFAETDLLRVPAVQKIMSDACLYEISQAYFGAKPNLDAVQMWWSPLFDRTASSEAAQLYHFDLERVQWLKWFVYLTDVDSDGGPHCFVRGSHLPGRKPAELLKRGYQRIPDADMASHFPKEDLLEITGRKGTVFVEDTSGFHKGKVPLRSDRLVLEIELSNTLFGTVTPRNLRIPADAYPPLLAKARARPQFLGKYALP